MTIGDDNYIDRKAGNATVAAYESTKNLGFIFIDEQTVIPEEPYVPPGMTVLLSTNKALSK